MSVVVGTLQAPTDAREWKAITGHTLASAKLVHGGLSSPGKMPCHSYGLPAAACHVGSILRAKSTPERPNVCGECYALKGQYVFSNVQAAQYARLASVQAATDPRAWSTLARETWIGAMVASIGWTSRTSQVFRWHDSGDLQSVDHLGLIVEIADRLPWVTFWIPTRERGILRDWIAENGPLPSNLTVRLSAAMVGFFPRITDDHQHSAVARKDQNLPDGAHACPAYQQNGKCGDCRACWNPNVPLVVYPLH